MAWDWDKVTSSTYWRKQPARGMREALPILGDALSNEYADLVSRVDDRGLHVVDLPVGYRLFKGRFKPTQLLQSERNAYADKVAWFGPRAVADSYNHDKSRRFLTYELIVLKPLTLVVLLHPANAKFIVGELVRRIKDGNEAAKQLLLGYCMGTGFGVTFEQQLEYYRSIEPTYTPGLNNPELHDVRFDIGNGAYVSRLRSDFHRVSIRTSVDTDMAMAVCATCGYDGYVMQNVPSFLCQQEFCATKKLYYLSEEIALCNQRGIEISIGGRIPDFLGLQAALFLSKDKQTIFKYFLPTRATRMVVERERAASRVLRNEPLMAPFRDFRRNADGYVIASRRAWDTDLAAYLMEHAAQLSRKELDHIWQQLVRACDVLAQHGVVHGDMKLENILFDKKSRRVALSDFGTAKVVRGVDYATFNITEQDRGFLTKRYDYLSLCIHMWVMCAFLEQHPAAKNAFAGFRTEVLEKPGLDVQGRTYYEIIEALRADGKLAYHQDIVKLA